MGKYAPSAMKGMWPIVRSAYSTVRFSGILEGSASGYGYHHSREDLIRRGKSRAYSIQHELDRKGDDRAASAIDFTFDSVGELATATRRMLDAARDRDPRLYMKCREFGGTLNGKRVTAYNITEQRYISMDSSHLWHLHVSVHRVYATNAEVCRGIAEVIAGVPASKNTKDAGWWHVDPNEVDSFLWGLKHGTQESVQAKPGTNIDVDHWVQSSGRTWGVTDDDTWFAKDYLAKGKHGDPSTPPPPGGGSAPRFDDDMEEFLMTADWKRHSTTKPQKINKVGQWQYVRITDRGNVSFADGPARITGHVALLLHMKAGESAYFRVVEDDLGTKGDYRRRATYSDHVEIVGTPGSTYAKFPINVNAGPPRKNWKANYIRIQWHSSDPDATIARAEVARWAGK